MPMDGVDLREVREWSVQCIRRHVQRSGTCVLDNVSPDGSELSPGGAAARQMTPGLAIQTGWFLLQEASRTADVELRDFALLHFIEQPLEYGWDKIYGGLYYYIDVDGIYNRLCYKWITRLEQSSTYSAANVERKSN